MDGDTKFSSPGLNSAHSNLQQTIQAEIFRVVTSCSFVVRYQRFGGTCCSLFTLKMEAARSSETFGNTPHPCTASQPGRLRLESSQPWKPQNCGQLVFFKQRKKFARFMFS